MSRFILVSTLGLICLVTAPLGLSQTKDGQTKESQTKANQALDRRLEDALLDIRLLKRVVDEQARRITALEKTVKALEAAAAANAEKPEDRARAGRRPFAGPPWQVPLAWSQIRLGMSRAVVEDILGPPTSVDSVLDYQTLNYKGQTAGGEMLSGTVKLTDDRVAEVNPPEF
jgi:hypothetical protein